MPWTDPSEYEEDFLINEENNTSSPYNNWNTQRAGRTIFVDSKGEYYKDWGPTLGTTSLPGKIYKNSNTMNATATSKSTNTSSTSISCVHIWRACTGKYGCYWWCNRCKKTRNVTLETLQEWKNSRNDSQPAILESIRLWKMHTT